MVVLEESGVVVALDEEGGGAVAGLLAEDLLLLLLLLPPKREPDLVKRPAPWPTEEEVGISPCGWVGARGAGSGPFPSQGEQGGGDYGAHRLPTPLTGSSGPPLSL